jgi:hypothetical protein
LPIYQAQLITYLKLANKSLGFLINFNELKLINGFKRIIQGKTPGISGFSVVKKMEN